MTREHKKAIAVAILTAAVIFVVTVIRDGTSW